MDPFTQRMLEKAEQRSKALGISKATKFDLPAASQSDENTIPNSKRQNTQLHSQKAAVASASSSIPLQQSNSSSSSSASNANNRLNVVQKKIENLTNEKTMSQDKVRRQFAVDKENMDLGIEINITTGKNVEVQVQVEEQETSDDNESSTQPIAKLRDTSRNRLQRLGALYSNNEISSPIHRTEGNFHEGGSEQELDDTEIASKRPKQRFGKLAALANSINNWEDNTAHIDVKSVELKPVEASSSSSNDETRPTSRRSPQRKPQIVQHQLKEKFQPKNNDNIPTEKSSHKNDDMPSTSSKIKQLKWDQKVMDSLEAQGFQRRDSTNPKLAYEYERQSAKVVEVATKDDKEMKSSKPAANVKTSNEVIKTKTVSDERKQQPQTTVVKTGLVSGRAAVFEGKAQNVVPAKPQKDPTELSLKERMNLFEKNKGEALVPKAAFGMAPSISKIRQDNKKVTETIAATKQAVEEYNKATIAVVKSNADTKVRNKVAALVANASSTISENRIKAEITKQRQEDMQVIANRFNKQKEQFQKHAKEESSDEDDDYIVDNSAKSASQLLKENKTIKVGDSSSMIPPPPPPPMPTNINSQKRRSPGNAIDEVKRARKSNEKKSTASSGNRLYPALSDLESNESDNDNCTTATISAEENKNTQAQFNESYMDSEEDSSVGICNVSLGREIMQVVQSNETHQNNNAIARQKVRYAENDQYYGDSSMNSSDEGSIGMDDYLDEALDEDVDNFEHSNDEYDETDEHNNSKVSRSSKGTTTSNSFSFKKTPKKYTNCLPISEENDDYQPTAATGTPFQTPVKSALTVNQSEDENMVTLVHTVSFYRRQQNSNNSTPIRKICRGQQNQYSGGENNVHQQNQQSHHQTDTEGYSEDDESNAESDVPDDSYLVQDKIKKLLDEVCKQQQVIGQTSQALNLCASTIEFSGSTESVEGERHLLVATHRRQASLDEIQRLRVENSLRPLGAPKEKGRLTVKEITIPLRQDYIRKLSADTISGHHLVCLLKYNEHVLATKTVPTLPGLVAVKFPDTLQLNNVYADFRVTLEIYGMTAQREVLPHEVKYHININKKGGIKTPKKKASDNRLVMPTVQSLGGPHVVRTPALVQYGFAIFSLREIQRTTWSLTQVLGVSPLEGVVHMKANCELSVSVEHKGFLTMFEDISGFGAWHRRWCYLNGHVVNYWKYPDDEKKKPPMGSIDLYTCCSTKVTTAPRDVCARLNTIMLECQRPARDDDVESMLVVPNGKMTIVRQLLSADTKDEREEWCAYFNKTLTLLRAWGGNPMKQQQQQQQQ